jgi:hypothetical protein
MWRRNCKHIWIEESRQFTQINPNKLRNLDNGLDKEEKQRVSNMILLGATSILLRCEHCGDLKDKIIVGDHSD